VTDSRLLAGVDAIEPVAFTTEAFRHVAEGRNPLSGVGARLHGGRWNPPDSFSTLYLALERETTIGEFYRLARRQGRAPEDFLPRRMYRYSVALAAVLDLRGPAVRADLELSDAELKATDANRCRLIGEVAYQLELEGILAPSAAAEGTVLAVFFDRLRADSHLRDLDYESWTAPPAAQSARAVVGAQRHV
jgi:RES domain-containing protein